MDYRSLGRSGLKISRLILGTMTFGGKGDFAKVGDTDLAGARSAAALPAVLDGLTFADSGGCFAWDGARIEA